MNWKHFWSCLLLSLGALVIISCVAIVPPWALPSLWVNINHSEQVGLIVLYSLLIIGALTVSYRVGHDR